MGTSGSTQDYGARIYNPSLGRFLSLDPMFNKYPDQAPYNFSLNSPLYFRDGDGNEVIDMNGNKVTIFVSKNEDGSYRADYKFTEGTSQNVIDDYMANGGRAVNALIQTSTGRDQVQKVIDSKDKIHTTIDNETKFDNKGNPKNGVTTYLPEMNISDGKGGSVNKGPAIQVTIHEGSIRESEANTRRKDLKQDPNSDANIWSQNKLNTEQELGSVAGHEYEHATNPVDVAALKNKEKIPYNDKRHESAYKKGKDISREYGSQNKEKAKKIYEKK